jgi:hypothetical protein
MSFPSFVIIFPLFLVSSSFSSIISIHYLTISSHPMGLYILTVSCQYIHFLLVSCLSCLYILLPFCLSCSFRSIISVHSLFYYVHIISRVVMSLVNLFAFPLPCSLIDVYMHSHLHYHVHIPIISMHSRLHYHVHTVSCAVLVSQWRSVLSSWPWPREKRPTGTGR